MNKVQIETFLTIVRYKSFSKASQALFVPQSTVSHRLDQLEKVLNARLLFRTSRSIELTDAGKIFLPYANDILNSINEAQNYINDITASKDTHIKIGSSSMIINFILGDYFKIFVKEHPNIECSLISRSSDEVLSFIRSGRLDIAITNYSIPDKELDFSPIMDDTIVLIGSYEKWKSSIISNDSIENETILMYPQERMLHTFLIQQLSARNIIPKHIIEVENVELIKNMVSEGMGISFLPNLYVRDCVKNNSVRIIQPKGFVPMKRTTFIGYRKNALSSSQKLFITSIKNSLKLSISQ